MKQTLHCTSWEWGCGVSKAEEPSLVIVDAQAVKTTAGTVDEMDDDTDKKIKGCKRHLATDAKGNVVAGGMTSTFVHDKTGVRVLRTEVEDHLKKQKHCG